MCSIHCIHSLIKHFSLHYLILLGLLNIHEEELSSLKKKKKWGDSLRSIKNEDDLLTTDESCFSG